MVIMKRQKIQVTDKGVKKMEILQINDERQHIDYFERDIDMEKIKKMAKESSARIQKDNDLRLERAIKEHDSCYISRELRNVSTYQLIKMILQKLF